MTHPPPQTNEIYPITHRPKGAGALETPFIDPIDVLAGGWIYNIARKASVKTAAVPIQALIVKNEAPLALDGANNEVKIVAAATKGVLSRIEYSMFKNGLSNAANPKNPNEALSLINKTLDGVELKHEGVINRMFGILDNKYVTHYSNGSMTALTKDIE